MDFFRNIGNFFSCILRENCEWSIKKILAYVFTILIIYLAVWTDKPYYELLIFVGVLVGVRSYERVKSWQSSEPSSKEAIPETPGGDSGGVNIDVDMKFKGGNPNRPSDHRILTD